MWSAIRIALSRTYGQTFVLLCFFVFCSAAEGTVERCHFLLSRILILDSQAAGYHEIRDELAQVIKNKNYVPFQVLTSEIVDRVQKSGGKSTPELRRSIMALAHLLNCVLHSDLAEPTEITRTAMPALIRLYPNAEPEIRVQIAKVVGETALRVPEILPTLIADSLQTQDGDLARAAREALFETEFADNEIPRSSLAAIHVALKSGDSVQRQNAVQVLRNLLQRYRSGEGWKERRLTSAEVSDLFFGDLISLLQRTDKPSELAGVVAYTAEHASNLSAILGPVFKGDFGKDVYSIAANAAGANPRSVSILVPDMIRILNNPKWANMRFYDTPKSAIMYALGEIGDSRAIPTLTEHLKAEDERLVGGRSLLKFGDLNLIPRIVEAIPVSSEIAESDALLVEELGALGARASAVVPQLEKLALAQKSVSNAKRIIRVIDQIVGAPKGKQVLQAYQEARQRAKSGLARKTPGNRFFVPITEDEFHAKIEAAWKINRNYSPSAAIDYESLSPDIRKDLKKIETEIENHEEVTLGSGRLANGLTYIAVRGGGDAEVPFYFIIYWDGKALRAYIPTKGNTWNTDTGKAYGHDPEADLLNARERFPGHFRDDSTGDDLYTLDGEVKVMLADIEQRLVPKR